MSFKKISEKLVLNKLKNIEKGNLKLVNYDGKVFQFGNLESKLSADIKIIYSFSGSVRLQTIKNILKRIFASNTKSNSLKYISKHYDLGDEFFFIFFDKSLTYSSAIYEDNNNYLEIAQKTKYQKLIDLLHLNNGDKILEIGCGWGGFSEYLAKNYNVIVDCITISKKQFEYTKKKIFKNGLNNKVNVMFLDYRDLKDKYDKVASIEMIEAVGEKYLNQYFGKIKSSLKPNGYAAIQGITIRDDLFDRYRNNEDFIQKYIFPGGFLPSVNQIKHISKNNKLNLEIINSYSDDYAKTLSSWRNNFLNAWDNIAPLGFDDYFKRMWEFYLSYCEAGFKAKNIDLIQFSMSNR